MSAHPEDFDYIEPAAHARAGDPETSVAAAEALTPEVLRASQNAVLRFVRKFGPCTDQYLVDMYQLIERRQPHALLPRQSASGLRTRRNELFKLGLIEDSGRREVLPSGRSAILWRAVAW